MSSMCSSGWNWAPNQDSKKAWAASRSGTARATRSTRRTNPMPSFSLTRPRPDAGKGLGQCGKKPFVVFAEADAHAQTLRDTEGFHRADDHPPLQQTGGQRLAIGDVR